jgi:hypothetical protein
MSDETIMLDSHRGAATLPGGHIADDYSVVAKIRDRPPKPWRWEIYRAGRQSPVARSAASFELSSTANVAGRAALVRLLEKLMA